jgi:hypothetical protein
MGENIHRGLQRIRLTGGTTAISLCAFCAVLFTSTTSIRHVARHVGKSPRNSVNLLLISFKQDWLGERGSCAAEPTALAEETMSNILHLSLHRVYFANIVAGKKRTEYRKRTPYWRKRLEGKKFDAILFRNGYGKRVPECWLSLGG